MMKKKFLTLLIMTIAVSMSAAEYRFLSQPDITPDGRTVIFCYNGDIWQVPVAGGTARRLTAMDGLERRARISPDGKWLAFSGRQDGNDNVYVMPLAGGEVTQLTFHDRNDLVESWSWDSKTIYFTSNRDSNFTAFAVSPDGGTPRRLVKGYFNTIHAVVEDPRDGAFWFTDTWESMGYATRKGYKGTYNADLKSFNLDSGEFQVHVAWEGMDMNPAFDRKGNLYFISDRADPAGGVTNLFTLEKDAPRQLTRLDTSVRNPRVAADAGVVVFERDYRIHVYDPDKKTVKPLEVTLFSDSSLRLKTAHDVKGKISAFDVSPDGKKLAFVSRGELFVSDIEGRFVRQLETRPDGRVGEVHWLKDSRTLLFNQTVAGWRNWFVLAADGTEKEKQITSGAASDRDLTLNPDRTLGVYLSGRGEVKLLELSTLKSRTLVTENLWGFFNSPPRFSPDSAWVVFEAMRNFENDLFLVHLESGRLVNITDTGVSEHSPEFSADGRHLYFAANRSKPDFPRGGSGSRIHRIPLCRYDEPFRAEGFARLFKAEDSGKDKDGKKSESDVVVKIDFERLLERCEQVSPDRGTQDSPRVMVKDKVHRVFYLSDHEDGKRALYCTEIKPFEKPETSRIKSATLSGRGGVQMVLAADKAWVLINGGIHMLDTAGKSLKPVKISHAFQRRPADEFKQMFDEMWAGLQENFYDEDFHDRDWQKIRERYRTFLPFLTNRNDMRALLNDMLGELNSSHLGFYSRGEEEKTFHRFHTATIGVVFDVHDSWKVERILSDTPLDREGKAVRAGDRLVAVNNEAVDPRRNRESYFRFPKLPEEMSLTFQRGESEPFTVWVHPDSSQAFLSACYQRWEEINQERVDRLGDGRIAYIHMRNMGTGALERFIREMTTENYRRQGLILDLRNNQGGNVHDEVLNFLSRRLYARWKYRGEEKMSPQPNFAPANKPMVMLINPQTLSDGEMTAAGFKALKLGTVVGTETHRWLIFTSGMELVDGSYFRVPSWGCFTLDGRDLELHGVSPDVEVDLTVKDQHLGVDPQLEKAVQVILEQINK
jgi:tricorn protease